MAAQDEPKKDELKETLANAGLPTAGTKDELEARIEGAGLSSEHKPDVFVAREIKR